MTQENQTGADFLKVQTNLNSGEHSGEPDPNTEYEGDGLDTDEAEKIIREAATRVESLQNGKWAALVVDCPSLADIRAEETKILQVESALRAQKTDDERNRFQALVAATISGLASQITAYVKRIRLNPGNICKEVAQITFYLGDAGIYDPTGALACSREKVDKLVFEIHEFANSKGGLLVEKKEGYDSEKNQDTLTITIKTK